MKTTVMKIVKLFAFIVLMSIISISCKENRTTVEIVNEDLKVYPNELGSHSGIPHDIIDKLNQDESYGYNTWRLPTAEELSLLKEKGYLAGKKYMTEKNKKGKVLLVTTELDATALKEREEFYLKLKQEYDAMLTRFDNEKEKFVDLGLSVKWAPYNVGANSPEEYGEYIYSYGLEEEVVDLGVTWSVPSTDNFNELIDNCKWEWTKLNDVKGYHITGLNGNSIFLPAAGYDNEGFLGYTCIGEEGFYCTSTHTSDCDEDGNNCRELDVMHCLWFDSTCYGADYRNVYFRAHSLRPVLCE